jgi:hypothetical protein
MYLLKKFSSVLRIRDLYDTWIRIRNKFFPDPGSRIPNPYFSELIDNFLGKKFYNSLKIGPNYFLKHFKNKIIYNFVKFVATQIGMTNFFSPLSFVAVFGSGIRDPGWVKIGIRDKHPGSATQLFMDTSSFQNYIAILTHETQSIG